MERDELQKATIYINFKKSAVQYLNNKGQQVEVLFQERNHKAVNLFNIYFSIAVAQNFINKSCEEDGTTSWTGANEDFFKAVCEELGECLELGSVHSYLLYLKSVKQGRHHLTEIRIDNHILSKRSSQRAEELLTRLEGGGYVLGRPKRETEDHYKLWSIEFIDKEDSELKKVEKRVLSVMDRAITIGIKQDKKNVTKVEAVDGLERPREVLKKMLDQAEKSAFIVGQNLYSLALDEIKPGNQGADKEKSVRKSFQDLLDRGGRIEMLLCDPASEWAVLYYALVFGEKYITDLCNVIPIYKRWQNEIKGIVIKVTQAVPLSFFAIDGNKDEPNSGFLRLCPMAFEPISNIRPWFSIKKKKDRSIFMSYYKTFHDIFDSEDKTRGIDKVSDDEIAKCELLIGKYRVGKNQFYLPE